MLYRGQPHRTGHITINNGIYPDTGKTVRKVPIYLFLNRILLFKNHYHIIKYIK